MEQHKGRSFLQKIAVGPVYYYEKPSRSANRQQVRDVERELRRFSEAKQAVFAQLSEIYQKTLQQTGEDSAAIFLAHQALLEDEGFGNLVCSTIQKQHVNAEYAVTASGEHFEKLLEKADDAVIRARAADLRDVTERLLAVLGNCKAGPDRLEQPSVIVAEDLSPSETVQLERSKVLAFVTRKGSSNSHTAILARAMNIPAVTGIEIDKSWDGKLCVVDGYESLVTVAPDQNYLNQIKSKIEQESRRQKLLEELRGMPTVTRDGRQIRLYANIGSVPEADSALECGAEGIGLFRSEFLYLETDDYPSEEAQFDSYKTVLEKMRGKKVIIRTMDIGADKKIDYFHFKPEENPAMGYRAIRICLKEPEIFKVQLRALLRASIYGDLDIMFPMITSVNEVQQIRSILEQVKKELEKEQIAYGDPQIGIMIETPAAVMISDRLAKEVDFFSIGTNDLTQYMLASDRQNPELEEFYDPHHPAVLEAVRMVIENAHKNGIWVGICGELAADSTLTDTFLRMGVDELSVAPPFLLTVRETVRNLSMREED